MAPGRAIAPTAPARVNQNTIRLLIRSANLLNPHIGVVPRRDAIIHVARDVLHGKVNGKTVNGTLRNVFDQAKFQE